MQHHCYTVTLLPPCNLSLSYRTQHFTVMTVHCNCAYNYCSQMTSHIAELFGVADQSLFKTVLSNSHHVLHRLLPNNKISTLDLALIILH